MNVPQEIIDSIREREGVKSHVYLDSLGLRTAGVGHLLSPSEYIKYPLHTDVPEEIISAWEKADVSKAYKAACEQAALVKCDDLIPALTAVNFQLGIEWFKEFTHTWHLMLMGDFADAANEVEKGGASGRVDHRYVSGKSRWFVQTPVRVRDFQKALRSAAVQPEAPQNAPETAQEQEEPAT